jgi:hypothetical protein
LSVPDNLIDPQRVFPRLSNTRGTPVVEGGVRLGLEYMGQFVDGDAANDGLMAAALQNLASLPGRWLPVDTVPGMLFFHAQDGLVSERMLVLPELLPEMPLGGLLASVPARDRLLVQPIETYADVAALEALANSTQLVHSTDPLPLSPHLYWFDGERWDMLFVHTHGGSIDLHPPAGFLERVEFLAQIGMSRRVAEG